MTYRPDDLTAINVIRLCHNTQIVRIVACRTHFEKDLCIESEREKHLVVLRILIQTQTVLFKLVWNIERRWKRSGVSTWNILVVQTLWYIAASYFILPGHLLVSFSLTSSIIAEPERSISGPSSLPIFGPLSLNILFSFKNLSGCTLFILNPWLKFSIFSTLDYLPKGLWWTILMVVSENLFILLLYGRCRQVLGC